MQIFKGSKNDNKDNKFKVLNCKQKKIEKITNKNNLRISIIKNKLFHKNPLIFKQQILFYTMIKDAMSLQYSLLQT
jgi:hypothetical protein